MKDRKEIQKRGWSSIIAAVRTPLGFFSLVVLASEGVLGLVASLLSGGPPIYLVVGMLALLFSLVAIVGFLAYARPGALVQVAVENTGSERRTRGADAIPPKSAVVPTAAERATGAAAAAVTPGLREETVSWSDIEDAATALYEQILQARFEPDTIVGVGRGGAIAQGVMAARFRQRRGEGGRLHPVQLLDRRYLRRDGHEKKTVVIGLHILDVQNRNVLLLNADSYTGATLAEAKEAIQRLSTRSVKTGTLFAIRRNGGETINDPDFLGRTLTGEETKRRLPWRGEHYKFEETIDTSELAGRMLIVMHGLVGTGKTSVANVLVNRLGCHALHTDEFWFRHGLRHRDLDPGVSAKHYDLMRDLCWSVIGSGRDAVLDCTSRWETFRDTLFRSFTPWGVTLVHVRCTCCEASALERIAQRKRFGPHDMGDETEYRRVLRDYNKITEREAARTNLIEVNTDDLTCATVHAQVKDVERIRDVCQAIEEGYLARLRPSQGTAA